METFNELKKGWEDRPLHSGLPKDGSRMKQTINTAGSAGAGMLQGVTLGFADEIEGAATAIGYGIGSIITGRGNPVNAMKCGYEVGRDQHRAVLSEIRDNSPTATMAGEFIGALASPVKVGKGAATTAPLSVKASAGMKQAGLTSATYGIGSAEGGVVDHVFGAAANAIGGVYGQSAGYKVFGRGGNIMGRELLKEGVGTTINTGLNKGYNLLKDYWKK